MNFDSKLERRNQWKKINAEEVKANHDQRIFFMKGNKFPFEKVGLCAAQISFKV